MSIDSSLRDAPATADANDLRLPRTLDPAERALFARTGLVRAALPGEVIFRRGEHGQSLYVIEGGEVRLCFGDDFADKLLGPGQYFGELSVFLGEHARAATAIAECDTVLREIAAPAFDALLAREPAAIAQFMRRGFAYLVAGEQQLVQGLRRRNEDLLQTLDALRQTRSALGIAQQLVRSDELTGLSNRRGLYTWLEQREQLPMANAELGLLLVDVDGFKQINDRCGHLAGDSALRAVAEEVRALAGPFDLPCRLGGDEFALLAHVADTGDLANRAISLCAAVRNLRLPALAEHALSVSVGGTFCRDPAGWSSWYSAADLALYQAKRQGGGGWRLGA